MHALDHFRPHQRAFRHDAFERDEAVELGGGERAGRDGEVAEGAGVGGVVDLLKGLGGGGGGGDGDMRTYDVVGALAGGPVG